MAQDVAVINSPEKMADKAKKYKLEEDISKSLTDFLREYKTENHGGEKDVLDRRYQIDFNSPITDFDCKNAKSYVANDRKTPNKQQYIALVCNNGSLQRTEAIAPLINAPHPNIMSLISAGVVDCSRLGEERFVLLYERPNGRKLSELIAASNKPPSFEFICQNIINPIALAIQHLSDIGLPHGSINCNNIYFKDVAVLGHFVAEPCGISQPFYYEPLERMQALPAGKGEGDTAEDYYALAVVVLHILYGMNHFAGMSQEVLMRRIMREGAFNALTRNKDMPEVFYDFFRGLLTPNAKERWGYKYMKAWLDGKRYNVLPTPPQQEAIRPFEFEGGSANTRREVAHLFFQHWQAVPEVIANGQLSNWVAISLRNKELNEYLVNTGKGIHALIKKNDFALDEQIMRVITVFDRTGPIRLRKLSFNLDGISSLFAELMLTGAQAEMQLLMRFIELSMFNFISDKTKENEKQDDDEDDKFADIITKLERLRSILRSNGLGFGAERVFYDLNPNAQCISPLLAGKYVANLPSMLKTLDILASNLARDKDPIDNHIAAFLASKLNVNHEIHLNGMETNKIISQSPTLISLKLLASAQRKSKIDYLPGISNWLALRILPLLDSIRSKTLKHNLLVMLEKSAKTGNLTKMADIFVESGYALAEETAFQQAVHRFKKNANEIRYYNRQDVIEENSKRLGTNMAHRVAVVALALSFYFAIRGGW